MNFKKIFYLSTVFVLALSSCSDNDETEDSFTPKVFNVMGKVEKGPMIRGSHVDMRTLDEYMTPTGSFYSATIDNNLGDFNYGALKINSPYAQLTADGYFFNEIDGELSEGTIKLDAIVDLKDNSTINVLTHLKSKRIHHLITTKGMTFKEANAQAQKELLTQFGLQQYASKDASQFSLTSGDDASGALIAISSLVLTDRSDAEIVEYLSILSNEFGKEGAFSQETKKRIQSGKNYLNARLDRISENIKSRYKELGLEVKVKDLAYYFDWDNDGIAGNELDESESVTLSTTEINVPKEGGEYTISIVSDKPYYLNPPSFDSDSDSGLQELPQDNVIEENYFGGLYEPGANLPTPSIKYNKTIENNTITIKIEPAQFKKDLSTTFTVYNARGKVAATVTIKQSGDKNYWVKHDPVRLGDAGEHVVLGIMSIMRDAVSKQLHLQTGYIHQENFRDPVPFRPYDGEIGNIWGRYYTAINQWLTMKDVDANQLNCYQSFIDTHLALAYYQLSSRWGGIPFIMQRPNDAHIFLPRTDEAEVLSRVENMLFDAMGDLDEHRYDAFQDANSMLFVSKNVARILLAFVYCNQKKFDKALPLLEEVIRRGEYHLEYSQATEYQNNAECILGYYPEMSSAQKIFPCLDYKDVILTAAECLYHTGNTPKAKEYINQVCEYKNLTADQSDVLKAIASLHYQINSPSYMNFIRRNGLGESFMGLSPNNLYQLLWPIPSGELDKNPQLTQNPGYY